MKTAPDALRVVHVVGGLGLGGGQKLTALVAAGLRGHGCDVSVINLGAPAHYESYLRSHGVPVFSLGLGKRRGWRNVLDGLVGIGRLWRLLWCERWDVVHTHMFKTALVTVPVAWALRMRVFGTSHRIYYPRWQPRAERALSRMQEGIVVDSAAVGEILRAATRIRQDKYVVIHNGIDVAEFRDAPAKEVARRALGLPERDVIVSCIAHLVPHKGQSHLVSAFARIASDLPDARLVLVGDGPSRGELVRSVAQLGLGERVHFLGNRQDLATCLAATDVLALPSVFEGFGIVQAEAMHLGLPVIATSFGGSLEVVEDGVTGLLAPFGDVADLAEKLRLLISQPSTRQMMGEAGRARVERLFTQDAMVESYLRLYSTRQRPQTHRSSTTSVASAARGTDLPVMP